MARAVRAAWTALSAATSGGTVDHEALAYQWVQTTLDKPNQPGPAHDVPDQETVILTHRPGSVVVRANQAAQPPVGHVQSVGVVAACHLQPGRRKPGLQVVSPIDSDMAAGPVVVAVRERPAHALREPAVHTDREGSAPSKHSCDLEDGSAVGRNVLQNLRHDHVVEALLGKREIPGIGLDERKGGAGGGLTGQVHGLEGGRRSAKVRLRQIGADDTSTAPERLERVPPGPRAEVEEPGTLANAEPVKVDGQQTEAMTSR